MNKRKIHIKQNRFYKTQIFKKNLYLDQNLKINIFVAFEVLYEASCMLSKKQLFSPNIRALLINIEMCMFMCLFVAIFCMQYILSSSSFMICSIGPSVPYFIGICLVAQVCLVSHYQQHAGYSNTGSACRSINRYRHAQNTYSDKSERK